MPAKAGIQFFKNKNGRACPGYFFTSLSPIPSPPRGEGKKSATYFPVAIPF